MSRMKRILASVIVSIGLICAATLLATPSMQSVEAAGKLNKTEVVLIKGEKLSLKVSGVSKKVKWSTSKKSIAKVVSKGKNKAQVTALKKGSAVIRAKVGKETLICKVKVESPSISKKTLKMDVATKKTLKMKGTSQKVRWSSGKKSVATVSKDGVVCAKKPGTAKITAKVGSKKYTCTVTVKKSSFYASSLEVTLPLGEKKVITMHSDSGSNMFYVSSDNEIVRCKWGKWTKKNDCPITLTAENTGTATVTITEEKSGKKIKIKVTVVADHSTFEEPNVEIWMLGDAGVTNFIMPLIFNHGTKPLKIYSHGARSVDSKYHNLWARDLIIAKPDEATMKMKEYDYIVIQPGESAMVSFFTADDTWYDEKTTLYFRFAYDDKVYNAWASEYYGNGFVAAK